MRRNHSLQSLHNNERRSTSKRILISSQSPQLLHFLRTSHKTIERDSHRPMQIVIVAEKTQPMSRDYRCRSQRGDSVSLGTKSVKDLNQIRWKISQLRKKYSGMRYKKQPNSKMCNLNRNLPKNTLKLCHVTPRKCAAQNDQRNVSSIGSQRLLSSSQLDYTFGIPQCLMIS